jgi:hypothetical protein
MKFNIDLGPNLDLLTFHRSFFQNIGIERSTYDLQMPDVMVRLEVSGVTSDRLTTLAIFDSDVYTKEARWAQKQVYPLQDMRYQNFTLIKELFGHPGACTGHVVTYKPAEAYSIIEDVLRTVYKVNKLKAFL